MQNAVSISQPPACPSPVQLRCMEIWGGFQRTDTAFTLTGVDVAVIAEPHLANAGGDVHYVTQCASGEITRFLLADVSGHGAAVASVAADLRGIIRKHINTRRPGHLAKAINRDFARRAVAGQFATAVVATYNAISDQLAICNAGHPSPLLFNASSQTWEYAHDRTPVNRAHPSNVPLGILQKSTYTQFNLTLQRGDMLLVYSDSLTEARSPTGEMLGEPGLLQLVRQVEFRNIGQFTRAIIDKVEAFRGFRPADDDLTIVGLFHNATNPPPRSLLWAAKVVGRVLRGATFTDSGQLAPAHP